MGGECVGGKAQSTIGERETCWLKGIGESERNSFIPFQFLFHAGTNARSICLFCCTDLSDPSPPTMKLSSLQFRISLSLQLLNLLLSSIFSPSSSQLNQIIGCIIYYITIQMWNTDILGIHPLVKYGAWNYDMEWQWQRRKELIIYRGTSVLPDLNLIPHGWSISQTQTDGHFMETCKSCPSLSLHDHNNNANAFIPTCHPSWWKLFDTFLGNVISSWVRRIDK